MTCPDRHLLDDLALGLLPPAEADSLRAHLRACAACRQEAAFAQALRLGLSSPPPAGPCLSDEELCHLRDDTLPAEERARAESHLAGCARCASALRSLERALSEVEQHPVEVPPALLERAQALSRPRQPRVEPARLTWLERLLQGPLALRLSVAGAAAGVMLLIAFLFYPSEPSAPRSPQSGPVAARPAPRRVEFAPLKTVVPAPEPSPAVADKPSPGPETQPAAAPPLPAPSPKAEPRVATLLESQQRNLQNVIYPSLPPAEVPLALGFAESAAREDWRGAYLLGRTARSMAILSRPALAGTDRSRLLAAARSLPSLLTSSLAPDAGREVLLAFVEKIESALDGGDLEAARTRMDVLQTSLSERLEKNPAARACFRLGQTVSDLLLVSAATAYRLLEPEPASSAAKELAAVRAELAGPLENLPKDALDAIRTRLEIVAGYPLENLEAESARALIAELRRLDRAFEPPPPTPAAAPKNP